MDCGKSGCDACKALFTVTLPLAKNSIIGAAILAWSRALGEFGATLMLVGATMMKTETLPTSIYLNMATGDTGPAMASALILLLISAAFASALVSSRQKDDGKQGGPQIIKRTDAGELRCMTCRKRCEIQQVTEYDPD